MGVEPVVEQAVKVGDPLGPLLGEVVALVRIGRQVVVGAEAPVQVADQLLAATDDHALVLDLGEGRRQARGRRRRRRQPGAEVGPAHARRNRDVEQVEHRRRHVDELDLAVDHARRHAGDGDDERNAELLVVERRAVVAPAVLVELLAVVGRDDDDRARPPRPHLGDEPSDGGVGVGDLAVVAIDVARAEREAVVRVVGLVGLEEVDPDERRRA